LSETEGTLTIQVERVPKYVHNFYSTPKQDEYLSVLINKYGVKSQLSNGCRRSLSKIAVSKIIDTIKENADKEITITEKRF
jgi:hypothetical protein